MALYTSVATRRRRAVIAVVVASLLAFGVGWLLGRQQVPSVDERVADVRTAASDIATGLERLDIEYEQVLAGEDSVEGGVLEPLDGLRADLIDQLESAPWIVSTTRSELLDSLAEVESVATSEATIDEVRAALADAAESVRTAFGV
jgi:hypothetical protein